MRVSVINISRNCTRAGMRSRKLFWCGPMANYGHTCNSHSLRMAKKGSLRTNLNSERNFADVSTRCSSLLRPEEDYSI